MGARRRPADATSTRSRPATAPRHGVLGTLDLRKIPALYAAKNPASTLPPDGPEQYTVSIRLRARRRQRPEGRGPPLVRRPQRPRPGRRASRADRHRDQRRADLRRPRGPPRAGPRLRHLRRRRPRAAPERPRGARVPRPPETLARVDPTRPGELPRALRTRRVRSFAKRARPASAASRSATSTATASSTSSPRPPTPAVYAWDAQRRAALNGFPVHSRSSSTSLPVPTPRSATPHSAPAVTRQLVRRRSSPTSRATASSTS